MSDTQVMKPDLIKNLIYTIRGAQVILDSDLANFYAVETRALNQAVKRNIERFPEEFRFQLDQDEIDSLELQIVHSEKTGLRSQNVILKKGRGQHSKYRPYVFTEQGVAMLSALLKSGSAIKVSVGIMRAFVALRKFMGSNAQLFQRVDRLEVKQLEHNQKFNKIFDAIEQKEISPKQGIIYDGQIFDAHVFVSKIIRSAKKSIVIIDNYIDDSVLTLLTSRRQSVELKVYTKSISKRLALDIKKFNEQYGQLDCEELKNIHDRFIIIDENEIYHSGASLKDLGKKISAFSKFEMGSMKLLEKLKC